jgi:hypothetical protein
VKIGVCEKRTCRAVASAVTRASRQTDDSVRSRAHGRRIGMAWEAEICVLRSYGFYCGTAKLFTPKR